MDNFALPELFLSFDVETDGKSPINNLLSIGICGLTKNKDIIFTFSENINPLPNHPQEPSTMEFWNRPENTIAWNKLLENRKDYKIVFKLLSDQLSTLSKNYKLTFIAQPSAFDWMFFKYYYEKAQHDLAIPFYDIGYVCICISTTWKTFIAVKKLNNNEAKQLKLQLSTQNDGIKHLAIDDAKNQGLFYVNLINHFA